MNMKKLMAGFAAASLAVTSLATAAFADEHHPGGTAAITPNPADVLLAEFNPGDLKVYYASYDVVVPLNGAVKGTTETDVIAINVAATDLGISDGWTYSGYSNVYYYTDGGNTRLAVEVSDIKLRFVYGNEIFYATPDAAPASGTNYTFDTTYTTWTLATAIAGGNAGTAGGLRTETSCGTDNVIGAGDLPAGVDLNQAAITFNVVVRQLDTDNAAPTEGIADWGDMTSIIQSFNLVSFTNKVNRLGIYLDDTDGDDELVFDRNGVTLNAEDGVALGVENVRYGVTPIEADTTNGTDKNFYFYNNIDSEGFGAYTENGINSVRLTNSQLEDISQLSEDAWVHVYVEFQKVPNTLTGKQATVKATTDLLIWSDGLNAGVTENIGANDKSIAIDLPAKAIFNSKYTNRYATGALGKLIIETNADWNNTAVIDYVSVSYSSADVGGDAIDPNTGNTVKEEDRLVGSKGVQDGNSVYVYGTVANFTGNGGSYVDLEFTNDNGKLDYKITLRTADGESVQPAGPVTIRMYLPAGTKAIKSQTVTHTKNDGTVETLAITNLETALSDGYVEANTSSFSSFGFEVEIEETEPEPQPEPQPEPEPEPEPEPQPEPTPDPDKNVGTGVVLFAVPALAAAAGVLVFKKRK